MPPAEPRFGHRRQLMNILYAISRLHDFVSRRRQTGILLRADQHCSRVLHENMRVRKQSRAVRNGVIAIWRVDPISGRLECCWVTDDETGNTLLNFPMRKMGCGHEPEISRRVIPVSPRCLTGLADGSIRLKKRPIEPSSKINRPALVIIGGPLSVAGIAALP